MANQTAAEALALARRLAAFPEPEMRRAVMASYLERTPPDAAVHVLDVLQRRGAKGGPPYSIALTALAMTLNASGPKSGRMTKRPNSRVSPVSARKMNSSAVNQ